MAVPPLGQGKFSLYAAPEVMTSAGWASSRWRHERGNLSRSPEHSNNTTRVTPFTQLYGGGEGRGRKKGLRT